MTAEMLFVFALLAVVILLFLLDRFRMDLVALLAMLALALSGVVTPAEAVSGFGASVVVMIAALFVVGEGLYRTGIAAAAGNWLLRLGCNSEAQLLMWLVPMVALLSAFMSSTGAVALFIPVVLSLCRKTGMAPSRLLLPLAYGALIGGMLTLIGTPPNIVVSRTLVDAGLDGFRFFAFTPIGLLILVAAVVYLRVAQSLLPVHDAGRDLAHPHPSLKELSDRYQNADQLFKVLILPGSPLDNATVVDGGLREHFGVTAFALRRPGQFLGGLIAVLADTRLHVGDTLLVQGLAVDVDRLCAALGAQRQGFPNGEMRRVAQQFGVAEVLVRRNSSLVGQTLREAQLRKSMGINVIGLRHRGKPQLADFNHTEIRFGDTLLVVGSWNALRKLAGSRDFVVLETPAEMLEAPAHGEKAPLALAIVAGMLLAMVSGWLPSLTAVLLAAVLMVVSGCLTMTEMYKSLNATSLVLIACLLPLAQAMEKTGAAHLIVTMLVDWLGQGQPLLLCAGLFLFTSLSSQFISNTATTVLVAPIALATSQALGLNPQPFLMAVAIAASTAFATPIASPVNTLVLSPGHYRFADFLKLGIPLQLLAMAITLLLLPWLFPFR